MSFGIGLENLIVIIQGCIKTFNSITPQEEQIDNIRERLDQLLAWLLPIDRHLNTKYGPSNYYPEAANLKATIETMTTSAKETSQVFQHFHIATRSDASFSHLRTIRFAAGNSSRHFESLLTSLERQTSSLERQTAQMDGRYLQGQLIKVRPKPTLHGLHKQRPGLRILFIDDRNKGRSILAQGYAQLLRDSTINSKSSPDNKQPWHITTIHSSGLHVRDTSSSGLSILQDRLNLPTLTPGETPGHIALSSLFDHSSTTLISNTPYKRTLSRQLKTQMSRGLSNTTFTSYDYIFVFSFRDNVTLHKLKAMVRKTYGRYAAPRGKAKIVMLGEYAGTTSEISGVPADVSEDGARRKEWDRVMGQIRVGFRGWLREELGWVRPGVERT